MGPEPNDVVQLTDEETDQNGASSTVATQPHTNTVDFVVAVASELAINAEVPQIAQNSSATETQRIKSEEGPRADTGKFKVPRRKAHQPQATTYRSGGLSKLNLDKSLISVRGEVTRDPRPSNSVESISQSGLDDLWNKLNDKYPILSAVLRVEANSLERLYQKVLARFGNYDQEIFYRQMAGLSDGAWNAEKKRLYPIAATLGLALNYSDTVGLYAMHSTASLTESELDITRVEGGGPAQVQTSTSTGSPVNPPETIINQNSFVENTTEEALIEASDGKGTGLVQDALALITSSELGAENRAIPETEATADHNLPISGSQDLERSLASPADGIINKGSLRGLDQGVEDNRLRKKAVGTDLPNASEDQSIALSKPLSSHGQRPMDGPGDTSSLMSTVKSGVVTPAPTEEAINRQSRLLSSYDAFSDEFIAACSAYKIDPLDSKGILCIHDVERAFVQWGFSRDTVESIVNAFLNSDKDFQRTGRPPSVARTFAEKVGVSFNQVYSVEAPDIFRVEANPRRNRTPSSVVQEGPKRPMPSDVQLSPLQQQLKDAEAKRERIRAAAANLILFRHRQPSEQVSKTGSQDDTPRLDSFPFAQENLLALIEGFAALDPPVETIGKLDIYLKNLYSNDSLSRPLPNRTALSQFFGGLLILTQRSHGSIKPTPVANLIATAAGVSPRIAYEKFLSKSAKRPSGPIVIDQLSSSGALIDPC